MSDLVENFEDRFCRDEAHMKYVLRISVEKTDFMDSDQPVLQPQKPARSLKFPN